MSRQISFVKVIFILTYALAQPSYGLDQVEQFVGTIQKKTLAFVGKTHPCPSENTHFFLQTSNGSLIIQTSDKVFADSENKLSPYVGHAVILHGQRKHIEWHCPRDGSQCVSDAVSCDWIEIVDIKDK